MEISKIIRYIESNKGIHKIKVTKSKDQSEYIIDVFTKISNFNTIKEQIDKILPDCTYLIGDIITGKGIYYPGIVKYDKKIEFFTIKIKI